MASVRVLVASLLFALAGPAAAEAETDPRPRQAKQACAAGQVDEGIRILAELYAITDDLTWVYNQGRCYQQNGRRAQALHRFQEYLRRATNASPAERTEVEGFIKELEASLERQPESRQPETPALPPATPATEKPAPGPAAPSAPLMPPKSDPATRSPTLVTVSDPPTGSEARPLYYASAGLAAAGVAALATAITFTVKEGGVDEDVTRAGRGGVGSVKYDFLQEKTRLGRRYRTYQIIGYSAAGALLAGGGLFLYLARRAGSDRGPTMVALAPLLSGADAGGELRVEF